MYIDTQETFSDAQSVAAAAGDIVSTNVYDTGAAADIGNGEELILLAKMNAALVGVGASIQVVLQDSADNATFADKQAGAVIPVALATANATLARFYIPIGTRRYLRVVYRITGATTTQGTASSFIILDAQYNTAYRSGISAV